MWIFHEITESEFPTHDSRVIPFVIAIVCAATQCVQLTRVIRSHEDSSRGQGLESHIKWYGESVYAFLLARLICVAALYGLFCYTLAAYQGIPFGWSNLPRNPETLVVVTLTYCAFLSILAVVSKSWSLSASRYNSLILLSLTFVYIYRDVWPLATTYLSPQDGYQKGFIWSKVVLLITVGIILPVFQPRKHQTFHDKNEQHTSPEQTASIFSKLMFTFMDPVVSLGRRVPHLTRDQMPALPSDESAKFQTEKAFPRMSIFYGGKHRHLIYGIFAHFGRDYTILSAIVVLMTLTGFTAPIGINQLLIYIESNGRESGVRPWVWVLWLFLGPFVHSLTTQQYFNITRRTQVRIEMLLTQLVFEHGLRIRLKGDTRSSSEEGSTTEDTTEGPTTENDDQQSVRPETEELSSAAPDKTKSLENVIGMVNTLVTSDISNITGGRDFLLLFIYVPLQLVLCMAFLFKLLGWSAFIGLITILVLFPIPGYITKLLQDVQSEKMKKTDARVEAVTEAVNVARMIKLFGWETNMTRRLQERRASELAVLKKYKILDTLNGLLSFLLPTITMLVTVGAYTIVFKQEIKASIIFPSMALFGMLREQMQRIAWDVSMIVQAKVSLNRVNDFLSKSELLDNHLQHLDSSAGSPPRYSAFSVPQEFSEAIGFNNATFTWSLDDNVAQSPSTSSRSFRLQIDSQILFKKGAINLITGPTGAGKTSVLMALLGEMHFVKSKPDAWYNLPRSMGIAYATQESWVQNDTIKNNIVFGAQYDVERYRKGKFFFIVYETDLIDTVRLPVIKQCALEQDLKLFDAGDETEVGERGLTLSGGQKARVTLARAIYSQAEILLLDDIFAALDVHTINWIINHCLRGDLVKNRTILLVTHNHALVAPLAEVIVSISNDGTVSSRENIVTYAMAASVPLSTSQILPVEEPQVRPETNVTHSMEGDGKLVMDEEIVTGHITWTSMKLLFRGFGGNHPVLFFVTCVAGLAVTDLSSTFQMWFLGYWATQYQTHTPSDVRSGFYLAVYGSLLAAAFTIYSATHLFFTFGALRASRKIHESLMGSIFTSTLRWLDQTPTGRIIVRCTQDINAIDGPIPQYLMWCLEPIIALFTKLTVVIVFSPAFLAPSLVVAFFGYYIGHIYLQTQLSVKRETSNAKSPILSHFSAAIHGLASIRAYGSEDAFITKSMDQINNYTRIARTTYNLHRWVSIRIEGMGAIFTAALAAYLVYGRPVSASNTGFSLTIAVELSSYLLWVVMIFNDFEVESNSLERIQGYLDIEHEPKATQKGKPPAAWPTSGKLRVEKLSARYSPAGPKVLHNITFNAKSGERIGVVGRTGSGKSSLALALLRSILTEGTVFYDGIPTKALNLDALRSNITIIPQVPELLSGTLRQNLDPFEQNDDSTLNDALRSAGLFSLDHEGQHARLNLDTMVSGGGSNLSVGQRQIIALARAMVRRSKVLILDEATSSIDFETDAVIQHTLRHELPKDVTVIIIAHRMHSVMDADKILALEEGRVVEFGTPMNLLDNHTGVLRRLVDESGHKEALYALAKKGTT
ncbi:multidrug resistance-associated ABC transporter [Panaeolus papilionaceus]|nr:multidrug resistance-associated ABC transporter [Panaeolus papilionaceus]